MTRIFIYIVLIIGALWIYFDAQKRLSQWQALAWAISAVFFPITPLLYILSKLFTSTKTHQQRPTSFSTPKTTSEFCAKCGTTLATSQTTCPQCHNQRTL